MHGPRFLLSALTLWTGLCASASAQWVQLPVLGISGVQTTVSVPDRGSALLGGVSRGAEASNQFGFSQFGSSMGRTHSTGAQRVFVTIHDFEEADRRLLSAPRSGRPRFGNSRAKHAWQQLTGSSQR